MMMTMKLDFFLFALVATIMVVSLPSLASAQYNNVHFPVTGGENRTSIAQGTELVVTFEGIPTTGKRTSYILMIWSLFQLESRSFECYCKCASLRDDWMEANEFFFFFLVAHRLHMGDHEQVQRRLSRVVELHPH